MSPPSFLQRTLTLLEMIKFQHTVFALPFAMIGAFMAAQGWPSAWQLGWILAAMVSARTCAMTFNRIADLDYDARNPRTRGWPLPAGQISIRLAWILCIGSGAIFLLGAFMLNWVCLVLAPVALFIILGYSYTKRFTSLSHFALGLALSIAPTGAWIAVTGSLALPPLLLSLAVICWVAGFDIIYACQDVDFDRREGLLSLPATMGVHPAMRVARFLHVVMVFVLLALAAFAPLGWLYLVGVLAVGALLAYEHRSVRSEDPAKILFAFLTINGLVSLLFMALTLADILWR